MLKASGLTDPLTRYAWAKFDQRAGNGRDWFPLHAHLEDTAEVARALYSSWLSDSQRELLAGAFGSEELAKKLMVWLGAAHDIGKATVAFAIKAPTCRNRMQDAGYEFPLVDPPRAEQHRYPHGLAGQLAVREFLRGRASNGRARRASQRIAEIVGGHHGAFPREEGIPVIFLGGEHPSWKRVRIDLLNRADRLAQLEELDWERILSSRITESLQALLTGFLIVCDWIASNQCLFPFDDSRSSIERAEDALASLHFGDHWQPDADVNVKEYFAHRFGIEQPRPVQADAGAIADSLTEPSLMLIEAPTGEGKTEIALTVAEIVAAKFGMHGAMIALPTRATANAMFGRVLRWLYAGNREGAPVSMSLAHSKAQFDDRFQALFKLGHGQLSCIYDEDRNDSLSEGAVIANQWFSGRKRAGFADFVVGTIDQLLFMTLKAKHTVLRHLSLSGKVLIIDEVHAADEFMRTYLLRALEWLGTYGVPVIALSATLPPTQRTELLQAYRQGAQHRKSNTSATDEVRNENMQGPTITELAETDGYPLITAIGAEHAKQMASQRSARRTTFVLEEVADEHLVDAVLREAAAGGCIAVVCNTVQRAQDTYQELRRRYKGEIKLFHSRFTTESRNTREQDLVDRLGPGSGLRPQSMIVVATQVVESSLDVDFDLMFTDIAPIDLLIQRIGRVHRHRRAAEERPVTMCQARVILSGGERLLTGEEPPEFVKGVQRVYGEALLLRSSAALRRNFERLGGQQIRVPEDVPELIHDAYRQVPESPLGWEQRMLHAEEQRVETIRDQQERSRAYVIGSPGLGNISEWNRLSYSEASEEQLGAAQVRDADLALEVVVIQQKQGVCYSLPWLPDDYAASQVDLLGGIEENLARAVATCTVSLPSWITRGSSLDRVIEDLEQNGIESWQRSIWLRGVLPLIVDENYCAVVDGNCLRYDQEVGLVIEGKVGE